MSLITEFKDTLDRLAGQGWNDLFQVLGIDINAQDLRAELLRPLAPANIAALSSAAGFEDLSANAVRPIEPSHPARSILFHVLASPAITGIEAPFQGFPTVKDLDLAENVVFGLPTPLLDDILRKVGPGNLAIGVFAREYRQRRGTSHGLSADMVFSRTGISRVGTLEPHWDGEKRAFSPLENGDDIFQFRTLPARYGVYIAIQATGDESDFGPYKFDRAARAEESFGDTGQSSKLDGDHDFWVPVHKLFSGTECLQGLDLDVSMNAVHVNEKLHRIHLESMGQPRGTFDSGFSTPEIDGEPFVMRTGLADMLLSDTYGEGILSAQPRPRLIEPTELASQPIGTKVPAKGSRSSLFGSFTISQRQGARLAPEWMHVRMQLSGNGQENNLNENQNVVDNVENSKVGNESPYTARHYSDFTGDGWVDAVVSGLSGRVSRRIPAYSILAAPDFYPYVSQSGVLDWAMDELPSRTRRSIWPSRTAYPLALSDQRSSPNLSLVSHGASFVPEDETVTAMIGIKGAAVAVMDSGKSSPRVDRTTYLTDGGAGYYAPGWDTSRDRTDGVMHLAAHGLGSPFPEDAKLCAAISAYWPAVAPDISGVYGFFGGWRVVCPMTDREIGLNGAPPWDGIPGPRKIQIDNKDFIEVDNFAHVDYVQQALDGRFTMSETMKVDQATYQARILANERIFQVLESSFRSRDYRILSFSEADTADKELIDAEKANSPLSGVKHKFVMVRTGTEQPLQLDPADRTRWLHQAEILETVTLFVDETGKVLFSSDGGRTWLPDPVARA
ncbi:MAG: hypothetical protein AAF583_11960 [Pseudomonadota bacterium]